MLTGNLARFLMREGDVEHLTLDYNENHDPATGQFSEGSGGGGSGGGSSVSGLTAIQEKSVTLSKKEAAALRSYSDIGHEAINSHLRGTAQSGRKIERFSERKYGGMLRDLDNAFARAKLTESLTGHRFMPQSIIDKMKVGKTFTDKGFVSTSSSLSALDELRQSMLGPDAAKGMGTIRILMPKGSSAIPMGSIGKYPDELEILANRDSTFKVGQDSAGKFLRLVTKQIKAGDSHTGDSYHFSDERSGTSVDKYIWSEGDIVFDALTVDYNENHDPANGQFTTGEGGGATIHIKGNPVAAIALKGAVQRMPHEFLAAAGITEMTAYESGRAMARDPEFRGVPPLQIMGSYAYNVQKLGINVGNHTNVERLTRTLAHETSHAYDHANGWLSEKPAFYKEWKKDMFANAGGPRDALPKFPAFAHYFMSTREGFAETSARLILGKISKLYASAFPHSIAALTKYYTKKGIKINTTVNLTDYNENHDPDNGEFTSGEGGSQHGGSMPTTRRGSSPEFHAEVVHAYNALPESVLNAADVSSVNTYGDLSHLVHDFPGEAKNAGLLALYNKNDKRIAVVESTMKTMDKAERAATIAHEVMHSVDMKLKGSFQSKYFNAWNRDMKKMDKGGDFFKRYAYFASSHIETFAELGARILYPDMPRSQAFMSAFPSATKAMRTWLSENKVI